MRRPLLLVASMLLGFASIAVALASFSLPSGRATFVPEVPAGAHAVTRYYQAVNHMIATGDPSPLREVVHPDAIDVEPPWTEEVVGSFQRIEHYLMTLHHSMPDVRIDPEAITGEDSEMIALVQVSAPTPSVMLGFSLDDRTVLWPAIERFRVVDGSIVERAATWKGMALIELASTHGFQVESDHNGPLTVDLNTYAPQAQAFYHPLYAEDVLLVLSGDLTFQPSEASREPGIMVDIDGTEKEQVSLQPGSAKVVSAGSIMTMPAHTGYSVVNAGSRPSSVLRVSVPFMSLPESIEQQSTAPSLKTVSQALKSFELADQGPEATFAIGQVSLMPGSRLHVDPSTRLLVVCAASDTITCNTFDPQNGSVGAGHVDPYLKESLANDSTGLLIQDAGEGVLFNAGSEPAVVWLLALTVDPPDGA